VSVPNPFELFDPSRVKRVHFINIFLVWTETTAGGGGSAPLEEDDSADEDFIASLGGALNLRRVSNGPSPNRRPE